MYIVIARLGKSEMFLGPFRKETKAAIVAKRIRASSSRKRFVVYVKPLARPGGEPIEVSKLLTFIEGFRADLSK